MRVAARNLAVLALSGCWPAREAVGQGPTAHCELKSLYLRYRDKPVDMQQLFEPDVYVYTATLDFAMDSFTVDALAMEGCVTDKVPFQAIPVPLGQMYQIEIFAKSPNSSAKQPYAITVSRLQGTETELQELRITGAKLEPAFNGQLRSYHAKLALSEDYIALHYVLLDTGQKIHFSAEPQVSSRSGSNASQSAESSGSAEQRRLNKVPLATGEAQYLERAKLFPVDHGHSRQVTITLKSSDSMNEREGTYLIDVEREGCNSSKPVYDPLAQACVINCGQSFYKNPDLNRCSRCNTNCRICSSLTHCELCRPDTAAFNYAVQRDGSCLGVESSILAKYFWWCVSVAMFLGLLALMGLIFLCQCLFDCCCPSGRDKLGVGSDSDADPTSERTLS